MRHQAVSGARFRCQERSKGLFDGFATGHAFAPEAGEEPMQVPLRCPGKSEPLWRYCEVVFTITRNGGAGTKALFGPCPLFGPK